VLTEKSSPTHLSPILIAVLALLHLVHVLLQNRTDRRFVILGIASNLRVVIAEQEISLFVHDERTIGTRRRNHRT
ncbi:hypothetical protein PFISCL1PPCAC_265, partial [Pristionchus fissidentatus]